MLCHFLAFDIMEKAQVASGKAQLLLCVFFSKTPFDGPATALRFVQHAWKALLALFSEERRPHSALLTLMLFFPLFYPSPFVPSGLFNNTLIIYILGDNGASAEGIHGTIDELLAENALPSTAKLQIEAPWRLPRAFEILRRQSLLEKTFLYLMLLSFCLDFHVFY